MPERIAERVERAIAERVFPGCVVGIVRGSEQTILPFGTFAYDDRRVRDDTIYDLASITKSIPVALLVAHALDERKFQLDDPILAYLPELRNDFGATIEDLLRYRVSGPRLSRLAHLSADALERAVFEHGFDGPPGSGEYSNVPAFFLGMILERVYQKSLDVLAGERIFDLLGLRRTFFGRGEDTENIAPTEIVDGETICGIVHDESARVFARAGRSVGHAGLFSNIPDLLVLLHALLSDRFPRAVERAVNGLGWQTSGYLFGTRSHARAFGKTGFTGTSIVCDLDRGAGFVILSNRTYPHRPSDAGREHSAINELRRDIADIVFWC